MLAAVIALVMLRLEAEGEAGRTPSVLLAELFIDDMDATLRQIGIGDYVVGKHVGKLMGALGGRLTAFRAVRAGEIEFEAAVRRNLFHDSPPSEAALRWVTERLERFDKALDAQRLEDLLAGRITQSVSAPEFSRPVRLDTLGAEPRPLAIEAEATERAALAKRFGLVAIERLSADARLVRKVPRSLPVDVLPRRSSRAVVASGEPVDAVVDEPFELVFRPPPPRSGPTRRSN